MEKNPYTSTEQAWDALQSTPSYVQRYKDDPFLYAREEVQRVHTERFQTSVEVDGVTVDFRDRAFCFDCQSWFVGEQHECSGRKRVA